MTTVLQNGNKISVAVASAAAVTVAVSFINPPLAAMALTGFFGFLGGLIMGKQL